MNEKIISIITICRNAENEIVDTIQSIINQNYQKIEYIIIDGASTDSTNEIIEKYISVINDKCISFKYISEPDEGIADAFNKGIKMATGEIIGLINAGDCLLNNALNVINQNFTNNIDILYSNTICIDKENNIKYLRKKPINVDFSKFASRGLVFTHQSAFVRKKLYDSIGLYDKNFRVIMDEELFIRFYKNGARFQYLDKNTVSMLAGGVSSYPSKRLYDEHVEIGRRYGGVNKYILAIYYILGIPVIFIKKVLKKNKTVWNILIGRKRRL